MAGNQPGDSPPFFQRTTRAHSLPEFPVALTSFELVDLLAQFATQPELLKIILQSKLQEDKRKAEEARLRAMQIDLMICEQNNQPCLWPETGMKRERDELFTELFLNMGKNQRPRVDSSPFDVMTCSLNPDFDDPNYYPNYPSTLTPNGRLVLSMCTQQMFPSLLSQPASIAPAPSIPGFVPLSSPIDSISPSLSSRINNTSTVHPIRTKPDKKKRNRKAMLPISMIVETKEFPYQDSFVWLNNGNTIQKKTGLRSTYYKCANWHRGCSVNKTVSSQGEGTYLIKYRGDHLAECGVATAKVVS
ncbi:hypothetical protein K493DRAFT_218105 [Basidiobolus meristosporus CBS 931.73]|uniref:WRKY domain-containing protein n=1 Tax=Basidiobolus meristosporus CBS 931.73 TaxID=1314790 RepID=A0A1Y1YDU7_9FUNG|nr:hypothetical protein K493DRAFT_218105 [Basidiobolus meristosporus CBS 931.73]|eukprot:ORX96093.1 hypothetical protein K493DRAFT_218105 [Basidiobolus meristosporus CBS 931.73]